MKNFKGKAIYNPSGKAGEYSYWACNFYNGCSNGCTYCYCKKGVLAPTLGGDKPTLKKCFKNEEHAHSVFAKELFKNLSEIKKHGIFFSFTTDPMILNYTWELTLRAIDECMYYDVPVKILTKSTDWVLDDAIFDERIYNKDLIAFGFTLTGHDELEANASTNAERIEAMKKLHDAGFKTWASIEPIVDFKSSKSMIYDTMDFCDLYKIGLKSGAKYNQKDCWEFVTDIFVRLGKFQISKDTKIYFKDSLLQQAGIKREDLPSNCVGRDYNMFKN